MSSYVMEVDGSAGDAYVEKNLGANYSDYWLTVVLKIDAASLAAWVILNQSPYLAGALESNHTSDSDGFGVFVGPTQWFSDWWNALGVPAVATDVFVTCELHHVSPTVSELIVDVTTATSNSGLGGNDTHYLRVGQIASPMSTPCLTYVASVAVGTTRGARDIFFDDFSSGDFSEWTSVVGDVTLVSPSPPSSITYQRIYGIPITIDDNGVETVSQLLTSPDGFTP